VMTHLRQSKPLEGQHGLEEAHWINTPFDDLFQALKEHAFEPRHAVE
jgi:hypothetical protein